MLGRFYKVRPGLHLLTNENLAGTGYKPITGQERGGKILTSGHPDIRTELTNINIDNKLKNGTSKKARKKERKRETPQR